MNDKEWLDKIAYAYKHYPYPNVDVEKFISWIYEQYGVTTPEKRTQ